MTPNNAPQPTFDPPAGTWSARVSGNWRVTFSFDGAELADVDYEDYHQAMTGSMHNPRKSGCGCEVESPDDLETRTLRLLLAINGVMFLGELVAGLIAESTGLLADSLDMLADASVYGIALYAVGSAGGRQAKAASLSGILQVSLGIGVLLEVLRRLLVGSEPVSLFMMGFGVIALAANLICLLLISKHRDGGVHMRASWIFSANDVIANVGVIVSGALVMVFGSRLPDLVVGALISIVVVRGGIRILREARYARESTLGG